MGRGLEVALKSPSLLACVYVHAVQAEAFSSQRLVARKESCSNFKEVLKFFRVHSLIAWKLHHIDNDKHKASMK